MKYDKIVLAGGNGYLGGVLAKHFSPMAAEVIILARKPKRTQGNMVTVVWDATTIGDWCKVLENADLLVNLCGKNVNCRYTDKNKQEIIDSRVIPTTLLAEAIKGLTKAPKLWINTTSATIYRHAEDKPQDEANGDIGYGFSVEVCKAWEKAFFYTQTPSTRKVALRVGLVMGRHDGVFPRLLNLIKFGLGGRQGDGTQYVSWVHEQDVALITEWLTTREEINGTLNCTAPEAIKNTDLMKLIRNAYGIPWGLPAPTWLLAIGAKIIGTETELILKSRWVKPQVLLDQGFQFQYATATAAVHDILSINQ